MVDVLLSWCVRPCREGLTHSATSRPRSRACSGAHLCSALWRWGVCVCGGGLCVWSVSVDTRLTLRLSQQGIECLTALESLNLYYNRISSLAEVFRLHSLAALSDVDLRLNPVVKSESDYRLFVVHMLPGLQQLGRPAALPASLGPLLVFLGQSRCWPFWRGELVSSCHRRAPWEGGREPLPEATSACRAGPGTGVGWFGSPAVLKLCCLISSRGLLGVVPGSARRLDSAWVCVLLEHRNERLLCRTLPGRQRESRRSSWQVQPLPWLGGLWPEKN